MKIGAVAASASGPVEFPLKLSANNRYLVDQNNTPFLINQASSWGLIQSLSTADAIDYLDSLKARGFNAVMVSIISYDVRMAGNPPNWQGVSPFRIQWDFSTFNEAYFAHADEIINLAKDRGMLVTLVPSYLGYPGEPTQGWFDEMLSANNSVAKSRAYGQFLGQRYKDFTNIIWVAGGDNTPAPGSELENRLKAIIDGIRETDTHMWTGHWDSVAHRNGVLATDNPTFESYMDINGYYAYDYDFTFQRDIEAYNRTPAMMLYHLDQSYETEPGGTPSNIRRKAYQAMLSGAAGSSFNAGPTWWKFTNWRSTLDTPAGLQNQIWLQAFKSRPWFDLVPDQNHLTVTSGLGQLNSVTYLTAARTSSGSTVMAYLFDERPITIDMSRVSGTQARAWWYGPVSGQSTLIGTFPTTGSKVFTTPTTDDWLLVLDDASLNLPAPGVAGPAVVAVNLTPSSASVTTGATRQFTATVTSSADTTVTWSVQEGSTGGTVSALGLYTAPATAGTFHVVATSVADATKSALATITVTTTPPGTVSYATSFAATESPISEGGRWLNGQTDGLDWQNVRTTPGLAFGADSSGQPINFNDPTAILTGAWGPNQTVQATVHTVNQKGGNIYEEVELRLRSNISARSITGYEVMFRCTHDGSQYVALARWNGPLGDFTTFAQARGPGLFDGDVIKATIVGNVITAYINDQQVTQWTDNTFTTGNPGVGFFLWGAPNLEADFGLTSFSATSSSPVVAVSLTPSSASVTTGATRQFTASVTGSADTTVTWSVQEGSAGGTVSASGLYTAPATPGTYHVIATSNADNTKSASSTVTVAPPIPVVVAVTLTRSSVNVRTGATYQFTANVTGSSNTAVTWNVQESSAGGTISTSGLYTAPATAGTFHVVATSVADATKSATATITVTTTPVPPPVPTASWINVTSNLAGLSSDCGTLSYISAKPDQDMLIASVSQQGYWASTDGAATWFRLGTGVGSAQIGHKGTSIVYDPAAPNTFWESGIYGELQAHKTTDNGQTFTSFPFTGIPAGVQYPYHSDSISVDLTDPARKTILLGSHEGPKIVLRSSDSGQTWVNVGANIPSSLSTGFVLVLNAQTYLVGCVNNDSAAIFRTTDSGATWTQVSDNGGIWVPLRASDGRIYWLARDGIVRSDDQGATWTTLATGNVLKFLPLYYAPSPIELPNGKIAALGNNNEIVVSADLGATWTAVTTPLPFTRGLFNTKLTYSSFRKAFFFSNASCDNQVPADAVLRYGYDATSTVPPPPAIVAVSLTPSTASVTTGATQQFTATVTGSSNATVTWSVQEGSTGGTVSSSGLYTAPATAGTFHVVATSAADNTKSAMAAITVTAPIPVPVVAVSLTRSSASVTTGATYQFTASVTGSSNTAVTWSVQEGGAGGTVSSSGLYTAPATAGTFHVVATSSADNTKSATATITVTAPIPPPISAVSLTPASASVTTGATQQFTATVTGSSNTAVTWSVQESAASATGVWTNVTPSNASIIGDSFGTTSIEVDPRRPSDLYAHYDNLGIWKSTDYGQTWTGPINTGINGINCTGAGGFAIADGGPGNPPILYISNLRFGIAGGGRTLEGIGFWRSVDGGVNWTHPFIAPTPGRQDYLKPAVDPYDPQHLLMTGHEMDVIVESFDGGTTWVNAPLAPGMVGLGGSAAVFFINTGDSATTRSTWLWLHQLTDNNGTWRTTDSGATWTKVDKNEKIHGTSQIYQPGNGVIYMAGVYSTLGTGVLRSADYGQTWQHVGSFANEAVVFGTPNNVYSGYSFAQGPGSVPANMQMVAQPGTGTWASVTTPPEMLQGPAWAAVTNDGTNNIIVTANWTAGLWRYIEPNATGVAPAVGSSGGTVSASGLYTAPTTPGTYHVVATSNADPTKSATATITVTAPNPVPVVAVSLTPTSASVTTGATNQFTATVTGSSNTAVTWSVQEGSAGGTVSASGLYTAPSTAGTFHVVATSNADNTKSASSTVTVTTPPPVPVVAVSLTPSTASVATGATNQFTATVTGSSNTAVTWNVQEGSAGGTVSASGLYTAPATAGTFHLVATSVADNTKSASAAITVSPSGGGSNSISPMPLISRNKPAYVSSLAIAVSATAANDANRESRWVSSELPAWIAYDLSSVPIEQRQQVLVAWYAPLGLGYIYPSPGAFLQLPVDYTIETNTAPGGTGSAPTTGWQVAVSVTGNDRASREHLFNLAGANWIRLVATAGSDPAAIGIDLDVHSAPDGASDAWLFMGDSNTGIVAYLFSDLPTLVNGLAPNRWPVIVPAAIGGTSVFTANDTIDAALSTFPGRYVTLNYGTNLSFAGFGPAMEILIGKVHAAGKIPVIPHMPWSTLPEWQVKGPIINAVIDALYLKYPDIVHGPNLWDGLAGHPEWMADNEIHPSPLGMEEMRRLWAVAMTANSSNPPATVAVSLTPSTASVTTGATNQFTATVTGSNNTAVTWSVQEGSTGGTVSASGLYTAPATAGTFHVVATSNADNTKSASSTITVTTPPPVPVVAISLTPSTASVTTGATNQFTATVTGSNNTAVIWSVQEGSAGGTVSASGLYTAPASTGIFHVVATSVADTSKSATATITVTPTPVNPPVPTANWINVTSNLAGLSSDCGTLSFLSAKPDQDMLIASVSQQGYWASIDGAATWFRLGTGAGSANIGHKGTSIVYDPAAPNTFWESGIYGELKSYKTTDNGQTFTSFPFTGVPSGVSYPYHNASISVDLTDPARKTILLGSQEGAKIVLRSTDSGQTWVNIGANIPSSLLSGNVLVLDAQTYLVGCSNNDSAAIFRTTNAGATWTQVSDNGGIHLPLRASDGRIYWLGRDGIVRSDDQGATWTTLATGNVLKFLPAFYAPSPIELPNGKIAALGNNNEILVSADFGATWNAVTTPLPFTRGFSNPQLTYSNFRKAFFFSNASCDNQVPADAVLRYGYDATSTTPIVAVSLTPTSASITTGATNQFTATVTGSSNTAVTWSVQEGNAGGTVNASGLYTAPAIAGTFHVVATSNADNTKSATATITVTTPPPVPVVAVSLTPSTASVTTGATNQFTATVTGSSNTTVTWSVQEGSTGGTVSASGLYTAPVIAGTFHVVATSNADTTKSANSTVTVTTPPLVPVVAVSLTPTTASVTTGATNQLTATVTGSSNTAVTWSVQEGSTGGTVSASGLYTAPVTAGTYHVKAVSVADSTKFGAATITVTLANTALKVAPVVRIKRDDRSAILDMDYNADNPWGQWWVMTGSGKDDAGFLVTWWPDGASPSAMGSMGGCMGCAGACGNPTDPMAVSKSLVTPNRRVQLQPLANGGIYHVCVERINSLGEITSQRTELTFNGGDGARVDALRSSLTFFDDFNLPMGAANEKLWNAAASTETDYRLNLFFINDQFHAHSLNATVRNGGKSQTAQRFRKPIAIENGVRRHVFFDMDSPLSSRSVWYLDFNPVKLDLTGHADFFDAEGVKGLPAGLLRLRSQFQQFSVSLIGADGASHLMGVADMQALGVQAVSNVRRNFEARVGTDGVEILVDGKSIINAPFPPDTFKPGAYELLWNAFGYNTSKDNVPYYLVHWDNFGFDGPDLEPGAVHNYVTRIAGTDYQKATRGISKFPTFTVNIPDDLRPVVDGATAEAWLVFTYQSGDYSSVNILPSDYLLVNGGARITLPPIPNNTTPLDPSLLSFDKPYTVRVKLGDLMKGSASPLLIGDNTFKFYADNAGLVNVHVEVFYPQAGEPAYTPPSAIHPFPMHADVPKLGPPARFEMIGGTEINRFAYNVNDPTVLTVPVSGVIPINVLVGNESYAGWAPDLMVFPAQSQEIWGTGGVAGISTVELFLRRVGTGTGPGDRVAQLSTFRDAPAPQGRYALQLNTRAFPNGDYELFVLATTPTGVKSHPTYQGAVESIDVGQLSGAYYPIHIKIQN